MADFLIRFCISSICLTVHLGLIFAFCSTEKSAIIEIGYRSSNPKMKAQSTNKMISILRALTLIDLYKQTKRNREIARKYFICNAGLLIAGVTGIILWLIMVIVSKSIGEIVYWQLGFTMDVVIVWAGTHFVLDALYLPSERKRRNID